MGLNGTGNWPFSVFRFYLQLLKSTNIVIQTLYAVETDLSETYVSYNTITVFLRDLLDKVKTNPFLKDGIYRELQKSIKVICPNPIITKYMDVEVYEFYRELVERMTKSRSPKSFSELLSTLYGGDASQVLTNPIMNNSSSPKLRKQDSFLSPFNKRFSVFMSPEFVSSAGSDLENVVSNAKGRPSVTYQELRKFMMTEL